MKRLQLSIALAAVALTAAAGCGDNSKTCGPGTQDSDDDGECEPVPTQPMCTNGTILDTATNSCVIDPMACQNGTVLIDGKCVDPTAGLKVDLTERTEPNNLGIGGLETSTSNAGDIALKPAGSVFVVKGTINPHRDGNGNGEVDADMDAYALDVAGPTLVEVTVDGVGGLMGAFLAQSDAVTLAPGWRRFGINVTGDASKRQLYFPAAGKYYVSVGDTRSLSVGVGSPPAAGAGAAAGGPGFTYFMSLKVLPIPAPTTLTLTDGKVTASSTLNVGEVKLYTVPMGLGINTASLRMVGTPAAALVIGRNGTYKDEGIEPSAIPPAPASADLVGFRADESALLVVDTAYHYGPGATPFDLAVTTRGAGQLSTSGGTATQPESAVDFSTFYYDVSAADEVLGLTLAWNQPVAGVIVDESFNVFANFTFSPTAGAFTARRFAGYTGLLRHRAAGRYYFLTFDPGATGPTDIIATSTIAAATVGTVIKGTPLTGQTLNAVQSNPYVYAPGIAADPWQLFDGVGTGTGNITNTFFNTTNAYGRIDALTTTGTGTIVNDVVPLFTQTHPESGRPQGRVMIDDAVTTLFFTTRLATTTGSPTFTLDFKPRTFHNFGTVVGGDMPARTGEVIDATTPVQYYLLRTASDNKINLTVDPVTPTLDSRARILNRDETLSREINNFGAGVDDVGTVSQAASGWTAMAVSTAAILTDPATFNLSLAIVNAPYRREASATTFADACEGGVTVPLVADSSTFPANDEGTSAAIDAPSGFQFFGQAATQLRVSSNGWLTFGAITTALFVNQDMPLPGNPNAVVAPFWDDLAGIVVCTKAAGSKLTIQWVGTRFNQPTQTVQFQAILDGTNQQLELVWGPNHKPANAGDSATVGLENQGGTDASKISFNQPNATPASTAVRFIPN
jgi:hypothetical protein